jgi:hypothetical protein
MDRDGDGRVFRPLAMPQVSEQFLNQTAVTGLDLTGA